MDLLSSVVRCLLGARLKIYPFSVESGFFSYTFSSVFFEQNEQNYANLVYC